MPEGLPDKTPPQGGSDAVTPNLSGVCLTADKVLSGSPKRRNARTKPFPEVNAPNASPLTGINAAAATAGGRPTSHRVGRRPETINTARNHGRIVLDRLYRRRESEAPRVGTGFAMMAFRNRRQTPLDILQTSPPQNGPDHARADRSQTGRVPPERGRPHRRGVRCPAGPDHRGCAAPPSRPWAATPTTPSATSATRSAAPARKDCP